MNYGDIKYIDVANGPGVRVSIFVSGCTHHCKGCFNKEAWDFEYGTLYTKETEQYIIDALSPSYISGLSLLGGEPFEPQNQTTVLSLIKRVRQEYPEKDIWCYTGYDFEDDILSGKLSDQSITAQMIKNIDILVDGKFIEEKKSLNLRFRGSSNQRIIDVKKSLKEGKTVLFDGEMTI